MDVLGGRPGPQRPDPAGVDARSPASASPRMAAVDLREVPLREKARLLLGLHDRLLEIAHRAETARSPEAAQLRFALEVAKRDLHATALALGHGRLASLAIDVARLHDAWCWAPSGTVEEAECEVHLARALERLRHAVRVETS